MIPSAALLEHWQGHRRVTRRVIQAFPEDNSFGFPSAGCARSRRMALEMISMAGAGIRGLATRQWTMVSDIRSPLQGPGANHARAAPRALGRGHREIDSLWPQLPRGASRRSTRRSGNRQAHVFRLFLYLIDNEIHHRGQGYVYLRSLGIEPPAFYDRS